MSDMHPAPQPTPPTSPTTPPTPGQKKRADDLVALAEAEFGSLNVGEEKMLRAAAMGNGCDVANKHIDTIKKLWWHHRVSCRISPEQSFTLSLGSDWGCWERWGDHRTIRAGVLRWLCVRDEAKALVDPFGLLLVNALIAGELDLGGARIPFSILLVHCAMPDGLSLRDTHAQTISLQGSCTGPIFADRLVTTGNVFLRESFRARGQVRLLGASIGGNLDCSGGSFECARNHDGNPVGDPYALSADRLVTTGDVFLRKGFRARGEVRLLGASIGGDLVCIGGTFECTRDHKGKPVGDPDTLNADGLVTKGDVMLGNGFCSTGEVRLLGASIGGDLSCSGGSFDCARDPEGNPVGKPYALSADGLVTKGNVSLSDGFRARGMVRLLNALIDRNLVCTGGLFDCARDQKGNPIGDPYAHSADGLTVKGSTFFRDATFSAIVDLTRSHLGYLIDEAESWPKHINLSDCRYDAINAQSPLDAKRRLEWLRRHDKTMEQFGFLPKGFFDPQPYRQLARVLRQQGHTRDADKVMRSLYNRRAWVRFKYRFLDKRAPRARAVHRRRAFRRIKSRFGFAQSRPMCKLKAGRGTRYRWVGGWFGKLYAPVPYALSIVYWTLAGHGYGRWRPLVFMLGFIVLGWIFFSGVLSDHPDAWMAPSQGLAAKEFHTWLHDGAGASRGWLGDYPRFKPLVYSADTFLPLVNLHQEPYWVPRTWWVRTIYLPAHILFGWIITTMFAVSFSGLVRKAEPDGG
ncbi:MAG TPA: hypothetical protein ENJ00_11015 [Phycisphaerales bacterium]|nr:hypothetical protein [Phycisphaerales bacterium]